VESRVARALRREQAARHALMTPAERVALAARLGEEAIASYMDAHAVDRHTAIEQLKASRRLGRRRSRSADGDESR
jgi:hypothetical protein